MDAFSIPFTVWRNLLSPILITLAAPNGATAFPLTGYSLALSITRASGGLPVLVNSAPIIDLTLGTVLFIITDTQSETLAAGSQYTWLVEIMPTGGIASPLCGGPVILIDAPAFPS